MSGIIVVMVVCVVVMVKALLAMRESKERMRELEERLDKLYKEREERLNKKLGPQDQVKFISTTKWPYTGRNIIGPKYPDK